MTDFDSLLYGPLYAIHPKATDAVLDLGSDGTVQLRVMNETAGALVDTVISGSPVQVQTKRPCVDVRTAELAEKSVALSALRNASITFNSQTWRISSFAYKPGFAGETSGEVRLILMDS